MAARMRTALVSFAALAGLGFLGCAVQGADEDLDAIQALVAKINQAWKIPEGAEILREVLSDEAFALAVPAPARPGFARFLDKESFCKAIDTLLHTNLPSERSHDTTHILVDGPLAYEISRIATRFGDRPRHESEQLNVFAKGSQGWRLLTGVSMDAVRRALAENAKAEEREVRELAETYLAVARGQKPVSSLEQILMPDFVQSTSLGTAHLGKAENMALYQMSCERMAADFLDMDAQLHVVSLKMHTDSAILFGKIAFTGQTKDRRPWSRQIHETLVCVRTPGGWRVAHEHSTVASDKPIPGLRKE